MNQLWRSVGIGIAVAVPLVIAACTADAPTNQPASLTPALNRNVHVRPTPPAGEPKFSSAVELNVFNENQCAIRTLVRNNSKKFVRWDETSERVRPSFKTKDRKMALYSVITMDPESGFQLGQVDCVLQHDPEALSFMRVTFGNRPQYRKIESDGYAFADIIDTFHVTAPVPAPNCAFGHYEGGDPQDEMACWWVGGGGGYCTQRHQWDDGMPAEQSVGLKLRRQTPARAMESAYGDWECPPPPENCDVTVGDAGAYYDPSCLTPSGGGGSSGPSGPPTCAPGSHLNGSDCVPDGCTDVQHWNGVECEFNELPCVAAYQPSCLKQMRPDQKAIYDSAMKFIRDPADIPDPTARAQCAEMRAKLAEYNTPPKQVYIGDLILSGQPIGRGHLGGFDPNTQSIHLDPANWSLVTVYGAKGYWEMANSAMHEVAHSLNAQHYLPGTTDDDQGIPMGGGVLEGGYQLFTQDYFRYLTLGNQNSCLKPPV